jgi:hypothetical protein
MEEHTNQTSGASVFFSESVHHFQYRGRSLVCLCFVKNVVAVPAWISGDFNHIRMELYNIDWNVCKTGHPCWVVESRGATSAGSILPCEGQLISPRVVPQAELFPACSLHIWISVAAWLPAAKHQCAGTSCQTLVAFIIIILISNYNI